MYSQYYFLSLFAVSIETAALAVQHNIYKLLFMYTDQHISKPVVTSNSKFKQILPKTIHQVLEIPRIQIFHMSWKLINEVVGHSL